MCVKSLYPANLGQLYHKRNKITKETNEDTDQSVCW